MGDSLTVDAAQLVAMFMQCVFYGYYEFFDIDAVICVGMFLITFFSCVRVLVRADGQFKSRHHINYQMLTAALLMFTFGTLDVAFHLLYVLNAFIYYEGDAKGAFGNISDWVNVMKMVCYVCQTFVGDSILLLRCWTIYNKRLLVVIIPILLWLAGTASGIMTAYQEAIYQVAKVDTSVELLNSDSIEPWLTSMLCLTLATNVITTSLMVYRIWDIRQQVKHRSTYTSDSPLTGVMVILIESGLMYTSAVVILFGVYMASNQLQYGVSNAIVQIIGITFNLIITSVDRGEATQPSGLTTTHGTFPHQGGNNNVPLHLISIQTTVSRYPPDDPDSSLKSPETNIELRNTSEADAPYKTPVSDIENPPEWRSH